MELVNKFDNALSGVAGRLRRDRPGRQRGQLPRDRQFWQMRDLHRPRARPRPPAGDEHRPAPGAGRDLRRPAACRHSASRTDRARLSARPALQRARPHRPRRVPASPDGQAQDALRPRPHERARRATRRSRSWARRTTADSSPATAGRRPTASPRSTRSGGFIAPYAGGSAGFVHAWQDTKPLRDKRFYFGMGYGADANGFGAQGGPRDPALAPPVTLPVPLLRRLGRAPAAAERRARLRHQHRRRRPLRPLPRLDPGPADDRRRRDHQGHGPRRRGLPADVGARRGRPLAPTAARPTHASPPAASASCASATDPKSLLMRRRPARAPHPRLEVVHRRPQEQRRDRVRGLHRQGQGRPRRHQRPRPPRPGRLRRRRHRRPRQARRVRRRRPPRRRPRQVEGRLRRARRQGRLHRGHHRQDRRQDQDAAALPEDLGAVGDLPLWGSDPLRDGAVPDASRGA